jgi:hypothetical protein
MEMDVAELFHHPAAPKDLFQVSFTIILHKGLLPGDNNEKVRS